MVLSVLNSDPSLRVKEKRLSQEKTSASPQKSNRRSRAHNIPGGIKHLLSDPKRRRRVSTRSISSQFFHRRSTRQRRHSPNPATPQNVLASSACVPETPCRRSRSCTPIPINVTFPQYLPALPYKQVSAEVLASLGFTSEVPPQYIRDRMESLGPSMYQALRSTKATFSGSTLPKTLAIDVNGQASTLPPTHMAAVYSSRPSGPEPRRVMMYPVHQSILSLYCVNLPVLPPTLPVSTNPEAPCEVPVVPIALPNPESFPFLVQFLYLKNTQQLFDAFLTLTPASGIPHDLHRPDRYEEFVTEYSSILAQNYTTQRLASQAARVHGLWRNACALGISEIDLQRWFTLAWDILMQALTLSSNSAPPIVIT